nr:hypothetical protein [Tanacetum cinerariifolium]
MTSLTSMCAMVCQIIQKKQKEKQIQEEQAANARYWKISACCDDDDDYDFAITPNEPVDSLSMGDEHLNTIPGMESNEFINFSNVLFDADYNFYSSDDQSFFDEDFPKEIYSNPLFNEETIPMKIDPHPLNAESDLIKSMLNHDSSIIISSKINSLFDEFAEIDLSFTPDYPMPSGIEEDDYDSERDIPILEEFLDNYSLSLPKNESFYFDIPSLSRPPAKPPDGNTGTLNIKMMGDNSEQKVPIPGLTIARVSNQEKSPDLLSHQGLEIFQLSAKCLMMIHGKKIPILDVPLFHFYPLINSSMGELGQAQ